MFEWDFVRSVTSMRLMAELAADHGMALSASLVGTGVTQKDLDDPSVIVTAQQELRMVRNLVEHLDHVPALGMLVGSRYHFTRDCPLAESGRPRQSSLPMVSNGHHWESPMKSMAESYLRHMVWRPKTRLR